jgi:hypothetical protein
MIDLIAALLDGIAGFFVSLGFSDPAKKPRPTPKPVGKPKPRQP